METLNDIEIEQEGTGRKVKARIVKIKNTNKYRVYVQGRRRPFIYQRKDGDTDADIRRNYVHIINKLLSFIKPRKRAPPKPRESTGAQSKATELPGTQETIINQLRLRELERDNAEKEKTVAQNEVQKAISKIEAIKQQKIEKIKRDKEGIDAGVKKTLLKGDYNRQYLVWAMSNIPEFVDELKDKGITLNPNASDTRLIMKNKARLKDDELKALITPEKLNLIHDYIINKKGPITDKLRNDYLERLNTEYKLYNKELTDDDESLRMPLIPIPNIQTDKDKAEIAAQDKKKAEELEAQAAAKAQEAADLEAQAAEDAKTKAAQALADYQRKEAAKAQAAEEEAAAAEEEANKPNYRVETKTKEERDQAAATAAQYGVVIPPIIERISMFEKQSTGNKGKGINGKGTTTSELTEMAQSLNIPYFQGVLALDQLKQLKSAPMISTVFNEDISTNSGTHWCALIIDNNRHTVEYFDSLCQNAKVREVLDNIKHVLNRAPYQVKTSNIRLQSTSSDNCGPFAVRFLAQRLNDGMDWKAATGFKIFDEAKKSEKQLKQWKEQLKDYPTDEQVKESGEGGQKRSGSELVRNLTDYGGLKGGAEIHRLMADVSYKPPDQRPQEIDGYKYDRELSNDREAVYYNPNADKPAIISYRGTDPKSKKDLKSDVKLIFGKLEGDSRIKQGLETAKKVSEKYDTKPQTVGHSLGGATSEIIASKLGLDTITYAGGTSPLPFTTPTERKKKNRFIEHNISLLDPVSMFGVIKKGNIKITTPKSLNPHSLDNYKSGTKN